MGKSPYYFVIGAEYNEVNWCVDIFEDGVLVGTSYLYYLTFALESALPGQSIIATRIQR